MPHAREQENDNSTDGMLPLAVGRRPDPDPTLRTMELVDRAIGGLKEQMEPRFNGIAVRFEAMDKANALADANYNRVPTLLQTSILALRELMQQEIKTVAAVQDGELKRQMGETAEKFSGVAAQFSERDTRTDQRAGDTKLAVDAAFAAAKEATSKIEAGFTKQIDSMVGVIDTQATNLDSKISDVKDMISDLKVRLQTLETRNVAGKDFTGWIFAGVTLLVLVGTLVVTSLRHL